MWCLPTCLVQHETLTTIYKTLDEAIDDLKSDVIRELRTVYRAPRQMMQGMEENIGMDFVEALFRKAEKEDECFAWRENQYNRNSMFRGAIYELVWNGHVYQKPDVPVYRFPSKSRSTGTSIREFVDSWMDSTQSEEEFHEHFPVSSASASSIDERTGCWPSSFWLASTTYSVPQWDTCIESMVSVALTKDTATQHCESQVQTALRRCFSDHDHYTQLDLQNVRADSWSTRALVSLWHTQASETGNRQDGPGLLSGVKQLDWNKDLETFQQMSTDVLVPSHTNIDAPNGIRMLIKDWYMRPFVSPSLKRLAKNAVVLAKRPKRAQSGPPTDAELYLAEVIFYKSSELLCKRNSFHGTAYAAIESCKSMFLQEVQLPTCTDASQVGREMIDLQWEGLSRCGSDAIHGYVHRMVYKDGIWRPVHEESFLSDRNSFLFHLPANPDDGASQATADPTKQENEDDVVGTPFDLSLLGDIYLVETISVCAVYDTYVRSTTAVAFTLNEAISECRRKCVTQIDDHFYGKKQEHISDVPLHDDATLDAMGSDFLEKLWDMGDQPDRPEKRLVFRARVVKLDYDTENTCFHQSGQKPCYTLPMRFNTLGYPKMEEFVKFWKRQRR